MTVASPPVALVIPCHQEEQHLPALLEAVEAQVVGVHTDWTVVLVDDSSTDGTASLIDAAAEQHPGVIHALHGHYGSPGAARSAGVALARMHAALQPRWLLSIDADVELPGAWAATWEADLAVVDALDDVGAVNGGEEQDHLLVDLPVARRAMAALGHVVRTSEAVVGVTNLNGVNHAVRMSAYDTCGPYRQPTAPGPHGQLQLAGEDWDLGLRLRLAGYRVADSSAVVLDRGRRLLADPLAYASGHAYEGPFTRVVGHGAPVDVTDAQVRGFLKSSADRLVMQFLLKTVLAQPSLLDTSPLGPLSPLTVASMLTWMERWPGPTFAEDRNGFMYGRLYRFADAVVDQVRTDLGISHHSLLERFGAG